MKETDLVLPPSRLETPSSLYLNSQRAGIASRLFEVNVDLEAVIGRKKTAFRAELKQFLAELEEKKKRITFTPRTITIPIEEDEKLAGVGSYVLGVFGYERRILRTRHVAGKLVRTYELDRQIDQFVIEAMDSFEKILNRIVDPEATVAECSKLACNQLYEDERAILKVAVRRSFARLELRSWRVRHEGLGAKATYENPEEIAMILEKAQTALDRVFGHLCSKVNATRKKLEQEFDQLMGGLNDELVRACLDRMKMEQTLQNAMIQDTTLRSDLITLPRGLNTPGNFPALRPPRNY